MPYGFYDSNDVRIDPQWAYNVIPKVEYLKNGSVFEMNVNGSVSPVLYSYAPAASEIYYLHKICFMLSDGGGNDLQRFGDLTVVTNGLLLSIRSKGTALDTFNMKDNMDILHAFTRDRSASPLQVAKDLNMGCMYFTPQTMLDNSTGDYVRASVRDNLTGLTFLRISVHLWKVLP